MTDIIELDDIIYPEFIENIDKVVFIDFYSPSCGPCQILMALLPNLAKHFKDNDVVVAKVNVTKNPKLARKFMVQSVPLCVVIGLDKMVKRAEISLQGIETYIKMIENALGKKSGFWSKLFG